MEIDEYNSIGGTLDLNKLLVPLNDTTNMGTIEGMFKSFSDAPGGFKEEMQEIMWSFGLEYMYMKQFAIRAGYFHENENKGNRKYFTAGVGLYLNVFSLDFSYLFPTQEVRITRFLTPCGLPSALNSSKHENESWVRIRCASVGTWTKICAGRSACSA